MIESTARDLTNYETVVAQPKQETNTQTLTVTHKVAISKTESLLLIGLGILTVCLMTALVSVKVSMTSAQNHLDAITTQITNTNTNNVNLQQEVSEMTSYDRLSKFAKKHNLKMSNKNVRNVTK
ncbi:cell division protein FtsL [Companilactobacillus mishanensis]|uniref:Cell division protein FtsL n=1 Tax=Companilactobacillus mishanensis TaxID=2486008 RepID=A0A5P0ZGS2_9LACO|nr:cell division protein FtsL [Companilactobacillus mishanensis]MQS44047.1 cell division protein FtsL [Companilactobacillus mishanensis]MQS52256.1 cell division protein FtsL [Companilactobacillus mishanensis]MQS88346.1 cell division protein FtsL [Companilactobacillus mishanensis]